MGFERAFAIGLAWRLALVGLATLAFTWALNQPDLAAVRVVAFLACVATIIFLWRHIRRTNVELSRFVESVLHGDLAQAFGRPGSGSGFDELGATLDKAMRKLREERLAIADEGRFAAALVDESPVALLTIDAEGRIDLANKAARKLFRRVAGVRRDDFAIHGSTFVAALEALQPGQRRLTTMLLDGAAQRAMLVAAGVSRMGQGMRLVSVQPIQGELNAVELGAQADLVRVLTHEIMNSMTPVTSLASSAAELMKEVDDGSDPALGDARAAVETLARRAAGIMHFVETYRQFIRTPEVSVRRFAGKPWADEIGRLFAASDHGKSARLAIQVAPDDLLLDADPDLLAQVAINMVKNGAEAAAGHADQPEVRLEMEPLPGGRTIIAISDNGPGVAAGFREDVFLPFFTTKPAGTGVGLSLARRIVVAHGGSITLAPPSEGGARFEIVV
ncbi:histidine kinase [Sphingomonas sp. DBB INV C78]|uniref:sensor histidine kinase n=1 Tax=Sphingomonas sp. DBB INV C78 TaxID=3349434 RepID=UPI0036D358CF